ncbi:MAG: radical SAM protein [Armatimonadetes bacterium]|nr:radical SAM protein [Armatimonadota bacterium]
MEKKLKTILLFPPQWTPQHPPFALVSLCGHLRSRGFEVIPKDLNVAFYEEILTPEYLDYTRQIAQLRRETLEQKNLLRLSVQDESDQFRRDAEHFLLLDGFLEKNRDIWGAVSGDLLSSVNTLRDRSRFYDPALLVESLITLDLALELVSTPYYPARLFLNDYRNPLCLLTLPSLLKYTRDKKTNMFLRFFEERIPDLLKEKADLLAVSINSFSQVLPGLTLARMLKEKAPDTHISIGGNFFGRVKEALLKEPSFFQHFCHTLVLGEGEGPLTELAFALEKGEPLDRVPRLLYLDGKGAVRWTFEEKRLPLNEVGFLDLEGLPLDRYLSPDPVLCIQYSRGCYCGKCSFCDAYYGVQLDKKTLDRLIAEIKCLKDRYGIRHYEFIDECIPPEEMKILGDRLKSENLGIHWFSNARTEPGFTPEILGTLKEAGNTMLLWGIESGSERVMKLIRKGTGLEKRWRILRSAGDAGIWNFGYVFIGFPTETEEEARETIQTICDRTDLIHSYGRSLFTLGRHSPLFSRAEEYGILDIVEDTQEFSCNLSYRTKQGMSPEDVEEMAKEFTTRCYKAYDAPLWMYLRNRENLHLYVAKYGQKAVADFRRESWIKAGKPHFVEPKGSLINFQK